MIEPIVFNLDTTSFILKDLWRNAAVISTLACMTAWSTGFIIHTAYGFLVDVIR